MKYIEGDELAINLGLCDLEDEMCRGEMCIFQSLRDLLFISDQGRPLIVSQAQGHSMSFVNFIPKFLTGHRVSQIDVSHRLTLFISHQKTRDLIPACLIAPLNGQNVCTNVCWNVCRAVSESTNIFSKRAPYQSSSMLWLCPSVLCPGQRQICACSVAVCVDTSRICYEAESDKTSNMQHILEKLTGKSLWVKGWDENARDIGRGHERGVRNTTKYSYVVLPVTGQAVCFSAHNITIWWDWNSKLRERRVRQLSNLYSARTRTPQTRSE